MKITYPDWQIPILCVITPFLLISPLISYALGVVVTDKSAYSRGYQDSVIMCKRDAKRCQVFYNYITLKQKPKELE